MKPLPRIANVLPDAMGSRVLILTWHDGSSARVDVTAHLATYKIFTRLRTDDAAFARVAVGEHGADVVWDIGVEISADTLWRLAQESEGLPMTAQSFKRWREERAFTLDAAARALGLSRRMIAYYEQGRRLIPRVVALATRGLDAA